MKECDNSKIHISSNFILSICLLIMFDTLLLRPSLHCQHSATLHHTSPNYTSLHLSTLHFLSFTLHYPLIQLYAFTFPIVLFHLTSLNQTQYTFHLQTYFQNNEPLHCPKELLTISLHFTSLHFTSLFISSLILSTPSVYPTRCNVTQFIVSGNCSYMFRVVPPPIIRSAYNCIYSI